MHQFLYNAPAESAGTVRIAVAVVRYLLVAFFAFMAIRNLTGDEQMVADFQRWGYAGWFRISTALLQLAAAVLLVSPRTSFLGGVVLIGVLIGAAMTHLRHDPLATITSPLVFLALVTAVAWTYRPPIVNSLMGHAS